MREYSFQIVIMALILLSTSCLEQQTVKKRPDNLKMHPYSQSTSTDAELCNLAFSKITEDMSYYILNSLTYEPDVFGVYIEVKMPMRHRSFDETLKSKSVNAWSIQSAELVPWSEEDMDTYNNGEMPASFKMIPLARYAIQVDTNRATVYCRFWILQLANYDVVYQFQKGPSGWVMTSKDTIR